VEGQGDLQVAGEMMDNPC